MLPIGQHLKTRARWMAFVGFIAVMGAWPKNPVHEQSLEGLAGALAKASVGTIHDVAWEPDPGVFASYVWGRPLLFLVSNTERPQRDLYRAFVRLSPEGTMLSVRGVHNLSQTELADESALTSDGRLAVVAVDGTGGTRNLSVFDLAGEPTRPSLSFGQYLQLLVTRFQTTGNLRGLGRTDLQLPESAGVVVVSADNDALHVSVDGARTSIRRDKLHAPGLGNRDDALKVFPRVAEPAPLLHWAANSARAVIGAGPVAWVEGRLLAVRDGLVRTSYSLTHNDPAPPSPGVAITPLPAQPQAAFAWPPLDLPSQWPKPKKNEGHWRLVGGELVSQRLTAGARLPFAQTFIRPDPERPYAKLHLVAMDMRRLALGMRAGYEDPHPSTGPPGSGHIPRDPAVYERIVATFNGAFKAIHGAYGMKAEGRVLVPPVEGAATIRVDRDGRLGMGTWTAAKDTDQALGTAVSYRQNLDALVDGDQLLPTGRTVWGDQLHGQSVVAERSGLCMTTSGTLIYAWSKEVTGRTLARGMKMAGCVYGLHLDMNPGHCAFTFNRVDSFEPLRAHGEVLDSEMKVNATRYMRWSPKDFFYLALKSPFPREPAGLAWQAAPGRQPAPSDLAAVVVGTTRVAGITIEVDRVDTRRLGFSLRPGRGEPGHPALAAQTKAPLLAWSLGHATRGNQTGLTVGATTLVPLHRKYATLELPAEGPPLLHAPGVPISAHEGKSLVQFPVLVRDGALTAAGRKLGSHRQQAALCLNDSGHLLIGRMLHDTPSPLAMKLLELGCSLVVELDRGSHSPINVRRAGTESTASPPNAEESWLQAFGDSGRPLTYRF